MTNAEEFALKCFVPSVATNARKDGSKFCGSALLSRGESWPCCKKCNVPMQLFVQLLTDSIPQAVSVPWQNAAVQLFYCTNDNCTADEGWNPDVNESKLVRVIDINDADWSARPASDTFADRYIIDWVAVDDYPELYLEIEHDYDDEIYSPREGDKLSGWPNWIQGEEYPNCPKCHESMTYLFQVDSENNVPYMFGDTGCGHICFCPAHPDQIKFGWACC